MKKLLTLFSFILAINTVYSQTYPNNEDSQYQDMLTPAYYNAPNDDTFRNEVNKFVHFARLTPFQHPLKDALGNIPTYTIPRGFGDGLGPKGTSQHHNAFDMHVGNNNSNVILFASIDGIVNTYRDAPKYRDYLTITKNVEDGLGNTIGKIVVLYGHIDLNLDSLDNRNLNGQFINQGDTISKHLYSGTLGGAHLHFEIRYYRPTDIGTENYYGWSGGSASYTDPSAGPWPYGYWDPNIGYGFAHPENHLNYSALSIVSNDFEQDIIVYPSPTKDFVTIELKQQKIQELCYSIYDIKGQIIEKKNIGNSDLFKINLSDFNSGIYILKLTAKEGKKNAVIRIIKE